MYIFKREQDYRIITYFYADTKEIAENLLCTLYDKHFQNAIKFEKLERKYIDLQNSLEQEKKNKIKDLKSFETLTIEILNKLRVLQETKIPYYYEMMNKEERKFYKKQHSSYEIEPLYFIEGMTKKDFVNSAMKELHEVKSNKILFINEMNGD